MRKWHRCSKYLEPFWVKVPALAFRRVANGGCTDFSSASVVASRRVGGAASCGTAGSRRKANEAHRRPLLPQAAAMQPGAAGSLLFSSFILLEESIVKVFTLHNHAKFGQNGAIHSNRGAVGAENLFVVAVRQRPQENVVSQAGGDAFQSPARLPMNLGQGRAKQRDTCGFALRGHVGTIIPTVKL
eukprot:7700871-Pyramimonas_sp.AAC.1